VRSMQRSRAGEKSYGILVNASKAVICSSCSPSMSSADQRLFQLADYLAQHQSHNRKPPPAVFWREAAKYAHTALDKAELGWSAELRGRLEHAAELYAAAVDDGHPAALLRLADIFASVSVTSRALKRTYGKRPTRVWTTPCSSWPASGIGQAT
jgi:hypothetical protein